MGKGKKGRVTHRVPPRRKKKAPEKPPIQIKRIQRVIQAKVPDDMSLKQLSELYRYEGMHLGMKIAVGLPEGLIDQVSIGEMPTKVETVKLCRMIGQGLRAALRKTLAHLETLQADIEDVAGYVPADDEENIVPDDFVRLITLPEEEGGGICAELDPARRGVGESPAEALRDLADALERS